MTAKVVREIRADKPSFEVEMYDGKVAYYINKHPRAKKSQENVYLSHPDVIWLAGEPI